MKKKTWLERFYDKVDTSGDCWLWTAAIIRGGYGLFAFPEKNRTAHRGLWDNIMGAVPDGFELDHLCRVPKCVRLDHLEIVPHLENMRRSQPFRDNYGFAAENAAKQFCKEGHEYTPENTYRMKSRPTARYCRACHHARSAEYSQRKRAARIANHDKAHQEKA